MENAIPSWIGPGHGSNKNWGTEFRWNGKTYGPVLNMKTLLTKDTNHFTSNHASLTTPPCSEEVPWIILKEHIEVSVQQVQRFVRTFGPNARPTLKSRS